MTAVEAMTETLQEWGIGWSPAQTSKVALEVLMELASAGYIAVNLPKPDVELDNGFTRWSCPNSMRNVGADRGQVITLSMPAMSPEEAREYAATLLAAAAYADEFCTLRKAKKTDAGSDSGSGDAGSGSERARGRGRLSRGRLGRGWKVWRALH